MLPYIGLGTLGAHGITARELMRTEPYENSIQVGDQDKLIDAAEARIKSVANDNQPTGANFIPKAPKGDVLKRLDEAVFNSGAYAGNARSTTPGGYNVYFNPNADKAIFAHELGHVVSDRTKVGNMVRSARSNPALASALGKAAYLAPVAIAAINPGDDDMAASIALAYAASAPKIVDEILATKNGLAIMDTAGMRASLGQRGKLAAGLMTYLGAPVLTAAAANTVGNLMDDELVGRAG